MLSNMLHYAVCYATINEMVALSESPPTKAEIKRRLPELLPKALYDSGLTLRGLAMRSGFSEENLQRQLDGRKLTWPKISLIARQLPSTLLATMVEECNASSVDTAVVKSSEFVRDFPALLRRSRNKSRMTLRELARRSGIDVSYLSRMECGRVPPPTASKLGAIVSQLPSSELAGVVVKQEEEEIKRALTECALELIKLIGAALPMTVFEDQPWRDSIKLRLHHCLRVIESSEQKRCREVSLAQLRRLILPLRIAPGAWNCFQAL